MIADWKDCKKEMDRDLVSWGEEPGGERLVPVAAMRKSKGIAVVLLLAEEAGYWTGRSRVRRLGLVEREMALAGRIKWEEGKGEEENREV